MKDELQFCIDRASEAQLAGHLALCNDAFVPPLSERVDIGAYARKIVDQAVRFEAWCDDELVGLVAAYGNDPEKCAAFVTSVSVLPSCAGRGIAAQLVERCIGHFARDGFARLELEVDRRHRAAIVLYEKHGFAVRRASGPSTTMSLALKGKGA